MSLSTPTAHRVSSCGNAESLPGKPYWLVKSAQGIDPLTFGHGLTGQQMAVLYVTGPPEKQQPGVQTTAERGLSVLLDSQ